MERPHPGSRPAMNDLDLPGAERRTTPLKNGFAESFHGRFRDKCLRWEQLCPRTSLCRYSEKNSATQ